MPTELDGLLLNSDEVLPDEFIGDDYSLLFTSADTDFIKSLAFPSATQAQALSFLKLGVIQLWC